MKHLRHSEIKLSRSVELSYKRIQVFELNFGTNLSEVSITLRFRLKL